MKLMAFKLAFFIVICTVFVVAALPTIKITTPNGNDPPLGQSVGTQYRSYNHIYVSMGRFEMTVPNNTRYNLTRNMPADSVRRRGNSTATAVKVPYRIRFNDRVGLFGKEPARSWVMFANHFDNTLILNAIAFRLVHILGLEYPPMSEFANVEICNPNGTCTKKGIYQLTEHRQVNPGRLDIDKNLGWLVEFNFHDANVGDIMFTASQYNLKTFIKSPEITGSYTNSSVASYPELAFVVNELNAILNTLSNNAQFNAGAHRDVIDITSYAKYVFIQQFMLNAEWANGDLGSNFAHKDFGGKLTAGPIWDFDLATATMAGFGGLTHFSDPRRPIEPSHAFYRRFFDDEVFRARYRKVWDDNKSRIQAISANGGFIDSLAAVLRDHVVDNYNAHRSTGGGVWGGGGGSGAATVNEYNQEITRLKNWWNDRISHWDTQIASGNRFDASKDIPDAGRVKVSGVNARHMKIPVTLKPGAKGFTALLPANHGYTSYKLIDLQGREIRRGKIAAGAEDLRFNNIRNGVVFLRLYGKNTTTVLRATAIQ